MRSKYIICCKATRRGERGVKSNSNLLTNPYPARTAVLHLSNRVCTHAHTSGIVSHQLVYGLGVYKDRVSYI